MKSLRTTLSILLALCATSVAFADAPADAPAGSTGLCKDGSYSSSASKKGACKGHKGVKEWYAAADAKPADKTTAKAETSKEAGKADAGKPAVPASSAAAPAAAPAPAKAASASPSTKSAAPGGGPGLVWVNSASKVYHCSGDKWYGKTKQGEYLSEADAKAKGNRPEGGRACS